MCTIVEATLPAEQFALHETLRRLPETKFEIVRMAAGGSDNVMPFLWANAVDGDSLPDVLAEDPSTENVEVLSELDDEYLLRMEWQAQTRVIMHILTEENATIIDGVGENDTWWFRILFPQHDSLSSTFEFCDEYDIDLDMKRVSQSTGFRRGQLGLTEKQYEMITSAYEKGYYSVPRRANLEELSQQLDVSHQALSERLRRGHKRLVANLLRPDMESSRSEVEASH